VTSTIFCLLTNARWNVGISKDNSFAYDITVPMLSRRDTHIIDRIAQLLIPFNIHPSSEQIFVRYCTSPESDQFADQFLQKNGLLGHQIIGVNISAGGEVRFWGVENFQKLLKYIREAYPEYKTLLLYKPSYARRAQKIVEFLPNVILSPVTSSFDQFAALVKRLSFLVTPDTSAVHLASAFKIGAVVLYVQSNKALRIWEPYNTDFEAVITDIDDLSMIPVASVQESLKKLIERHRSAVKRTE
jgi:ADP-heptose:LPS heptosyltransferase